MMRKGVTFLLLVLVAVVWTACGSAAPAQPVAMEQSVAVEAPANAPGETGASDLEERKVVRRADFATW